MTFALDPVEEVQARVWTHMHTDKCPKVNREKRSEAEMGEQVTPTSSYSYVFTPTGIGPIIVVRCDFCKQESPQIFNPDVEP